ncbi:unnamed protein product [Rangifer tarandus platyrhynchus]|uniref:Uncharacterized protein n=1 Tax=Rangifer tarandus platyrhynchus TaxID=3082113 RepID=A0ABN8YAM0_RANTA|nr:unnamed protein product [Rangifer tarandus platyrhynchus]
MPCPLEELWQMGDRWSRGEPSRRQGRPCVPGSVLGAFDSAPWLLDRFLAQLDSYLTSRFEHHWDNLRRLTG